MRSLPVPDEQDHWASNFSQDSMSAIVVGSVVGSVVVLVEDFVVETSVVETTVVVISVEENSVDEDSVDEDSVRMSVVVEMTVDGAAVEHGCWSSSLHLHSLGS